jgi:hypothetical protein
MLNKWGKKTLLWNSENKNFAEYSKNIVPMWRQPGNSAYPTHTALLEKDRAEIL